VRCKTRSILVQGQINYKTDRDKGATGKKGATKIEKKYLGTKVIKDIIRGLQNRNRIK